MYACKEYADNIINTLRNVAFTYGRNKYLALFTDGLTRLGTDGTEASFTGYERKAITLIQDTDNPAIVKNSNAITFSNTGSAQTIKYVGIYMTDVEGTFTNPILWGPLASEVEVEGDVRFDAGSISWEMSGFFTNDFRTKILTPLVGTNTSNSSGKYRLYAALFNGDPASGGTEVSRTSTGYARKQLPYVGFAEPADDGGYSKTSLAEAITMTDEATGDWGNITHVGLMTASTSGYLYMSFPLSTPVTVSAGDSVKIPYESLEFKVG